MQIQKIQLENFRGFKKQPIKLLPNINVFVGVNGAGKSTILDAIAISLSWMVEGIQKIESKGMKIPDESIKNNTNFSLITLDLKENSKNYIWKNIEFKRGYPANKKSDFNDLNKLIYHCQTKYQNGNILPMIAYYPINRIAKGISGLNIIGGENIAQLDVYDNALGSKANFQAFFEWFRLQDDIINEESQSRAKYMKENKNLIYNLRKILKSLDSIINNNNISPMKVDTIIDINFLEEPKMLFFELMRVIRDIENSDISIINSIEFLLYQMSKLLTIDKKLITNDKLVIQELVHNIFEQLIHLELEPNTTNNNELLDFIWASFRFSLRLTFWWFSNKGKKELANILKYASPSKGKNQENSVLFMSKFNQVLGINIQRIEQALSNNGRELKFVTETIEKFIPEYSNLRVTRIPTPHMLVEKNGETIRLDQLSDGEKNMIAMIGDIARRLSMANPHMENPLEGNGIVLIDEIDLHLHPLWQRVIISRLTEVFPNCQFIVSTHSPQVLSHVKAEHIFILKPIKDDVSIEKPTESYGKSTDRQLEDILGVASRPDNIKDELNELYELIQKSDLEKAKELISKLNNKIEGREPELVKAEVLIKRKGILGK